MMSNPALVRGRPFIFHVSALLFYLLLSLVVTYPMILHFTTQTVGEDDPDRMQNMWNLWWVKVALLDERTSPFHTGLLFYPHGADLYFHTLNLPAALLSLGPLLIFGVVAAYNFSVVLALVLSGYAGFRLVYFLTRSWPAALLGGVIIGFNSLTWVSTRSQIEVVSIQWLVLCVEAYLRCWDSGRRKDALLTGLFFTLAFLAVGYFEVELLVFFAVHLVWALLTQPERSWRLRVRAVAWRAAPLLAWAGGSAALLTGPYLLGAWQSLQSGQQAVWLPTDAVSAKLNSADLLSFVVPNHEHWLFGGSTLARIGLNPTIQDHAYLGLVSVVLAVAGFLALRGQAKRGFWAALAVVGALLALGPILQVNGQQNFGGVQIPAPFGLLQQIPPLNLVRQPQRFVTLTYLVLGALAGFGVQRWVAGPSLRRRALAVGALLAVLLLDMPLHLRTTQPLTIPNSVLALARDPTPGAVLEMPFGRHNWQQANRMLFQIAHGRPITSGYLSRDIQDLDADPCSPLQIFDEYGAVNAQDVISPTASSYMPALLSENNIGFLVVYKWTSITSRIVAPIPPSDLARLQDLGNRLGAPISNDDKATVYRLRPAPPRDRAILQLGSDWYDAEQSYGQSFRWLAGASADLCVLSPAPQTASLSFSVTAYAEPRRLQVWIGDRLVNNSLVPSDQALHQVNTGPLSWPAGPQRIRFVAPGGSTTVQGRDGRNLNLGFAAIQLKRSAP